MKPTDLTESKTEIPHGLRRTGIHVGIELTDGQLEAAAGGVNRDL